jgi:hypothetical protein
MSELSANCLECRNKMTEVIAAEKAQRAGWYCVECKDFIKAIGRERILAKSSAFKTNRGSV